MCENATGKPKLVTAHDASPCCCSGILFATLCRSLLVVRSVLAHVQAAVHEIAFSHNVVSWIVMVGYGQLRPDSHIKV